MIRAAILALIAVTAFAQDYPAKPIVVVVPAAAGGPTDTLARSLTASMTGPLKQQMLIDNSGGAGGVIGIAKAAKARPDGYTLLLFHVGMATAPALYRKLSYDTLNDFDYIGQIADIPMTLVGKKSLPPRDLHELFAYVKANPEKLTVGHAGAGSSSFLCGLLFMHALQVNLTSVAYKGTGPAMNDLVGEQFDLMCDQTVNTIPQIKADVVVWNGLFAPRGTPKPALDKLNAALRSAVQDPAFRARLAELGAEPAPLERITPESLGALLKSEVEKWGPIIRKAGVSAD
ncbi:MAG: hypothetical protein AUG50_04180 [Betaproteobacteria bacterium 13_1_20CM_3_63_8]|nr:MAG: hypothetical protein AUG50_04180 [Betaproteobacteria bacterium 13_1_20CM_3_63_8]